MAAAANSSNTLPPIASRAITGFEKAGCEPDHRHCESDTCSKKDGKAAWRNINPMSAGFEPEYSCV
jgi:hypothetical protein